MTWDWEILIKILISVLCGAIIGAEREYTGKAAGLRTFITVALGSTIFSIISLEVSKVAAATMDPAILRVDPGRIAAQIVTGIGFIGAGLIIFQEYTIKGLTTAAGLWTMAAVGMGIGFGFYWLALLSTVTVVSVLTALRPIERWLDRRAEVARRKRKEKGLENQN